MANSDTRSSSNPNFEANMSSDEIYFGQDMETCITDVVNDKADLDHTHSVYATQSDLESLEDIVDTKADSAHSHTEYATTAALTALETEVDGKANVNHSHTEYASVEHSHNNYALSSHSHSDYASITHDHDEDYASVNHIHSNYATTSSLDEVSATVANKANVIDLNSHINNTTLHITEAERTNWNAKSDFSGSYNDLTNKPFIPSISGLATETYVDEAVSGKANSSHSHDDRYYTETEINTKLANKADSSHNHTGVYDVNGAAASALTSANAYTDTKINALVGEGASTTLDTIGEISSAIEENQDAIDLLNSAIGTKANASDLTSHTGNKSNPHAVTKSQVGLGNVPNVATNDQTPTYSDAATLTTLTSGEKLSVAFGKIKLAITNLISHIANKSNPHSVTKSQVGLGNVDNTSDTNKPISTATQTALDGKASSTHTHSAATTSSAGFMSVSDKSKLDGITASADSVSFSRSLTSGTKVGTITINGTGTDLYAPTNTDTHYVSGTVVNNSATATSNTTSALANGKVYMNHIENGSVKNSHKISGSGATTVTSDASGNIVVSSTNTTYGVATSSGLGLVKSGTDITVDSSGNVSVNDDSHNHVISNIDNLQSSLDAKQATIIGGASTITSSNLTTNRALVSNSSGKVAVSAVTSTELGYLDGVTSNVQTQLDGKSSTSHTHSYAGSSSVGGAATSANKLNTNAGDSNTPVYFSNGVPVACTSLDLNTTGSAASCTGNSATATKLQTAKTIGLSTGVTGTATSFNGTANISIPVTDVKEAYLSWGGKALSGSVSPIDVASSDIHSANRFTFAKAAGITIEYSTDGGSTYSTYSTTDSAKINLVSGIGSGYYIGARSSSTTVNDKLRITLNATNMGLYTRLRKLLINITTNYAIGSNVIVEKAMKGSESTYTTVGTYSISGWSGWNSIPINAAFGGGSTQTYNIANLRLTFGITGVNSSQTANALTIMNIIGIGDTYWSYPSNMAKNGHLYTYDASQNATFPAKVTASSFSGSLSGNATTATTATKLGSSTVGGTAKPIYLNGGTATACSSTVGSATQPVYMNGGTITACTYTLGKSVPSNAVFTDTTYSAAGSSLGLVKSGGDVTISSGTITVNDDSHNHVIANVDGLQTALDGKSATSHNHDSAYISKSLQMTADSGDVYVSWTDKDVVAQIKALSIGMYTAYAKSGTTNNPKTTEAWRFMVHKTSATYGWTMAFGSYGSVYSGYVDNGNWKGWRCIYDVSPAPLWTGAMYMSSSNGTPQVVTPSKKLSECQHGWLLLWSDYDPGDGANDADFVTTMIPKRNATGGTWGGKSFLCDIPRYVGSDATDTSTEKRIIKPIYVHDDCIKGSYQNASGDRNDVVLRAVYEY